MKTKFSNFEKLIKDKVNSIEFPYDAAQFTKLQSKIKGGGAASPFYWLIGAAAVASIIIGGSTLIKEVSEKSTVRTNHSAKLFDDELIIAESPAIKKKQTQELKLDNDNSIKLEFNDSKTEIKLSVNMNEEHVGHEIISPNDSKTLKDLRKEKLEELLKQKIKESKGKKDAPEIMTDELSLIQPIILPSALELCQGEMIELDVIDVNDSEIATDYSWYLDGEKISIEKQLSYKLKESGTHMFYLEISSKEDRSVRASSQEISVTVKEEPALDFEFDESDLAYRPENTFINKSQGANNFVWEFGDYQKSEEKSPKHIYTKKGDYVVKLTGKGQNGCESSLEKTVRIDQGYNLLAGTSFTPDGDGLNETWFPRALEILDYPFTLVIFDRAGRMVYQTKGISPWDGTSIIDGSQCKRGEVYVWKVELTNEKGEREEYRGHVTILN